jgi:Na+/proline symporter
MDMIVPFGKTVMIAVLFVISVAGIIGYSYISVRTLNLRESYEEKRKRAIVGGALVFLSCLGLSAVALIRQPVLHLAPVFLVISLVIGVLATETILSPAQLANFWKKRTKRKDRLSNTSKDDPAKRAGDH